MKRKHSDAAKEAIRQSSLAQGQVREDTVVTAIKEAMDAMASEILANDGIYPKNKGRMSINEVCRRAGVHNTTIFGTKYETTKKSIHDWIDALRTTAATTTTEARKTEAKRAADWRELFESLKAQHLLVSDQLLEERRLRLIMERQISALEAKLAKVNRANVVQLRSIPSRNGE